MSNQITVISEISNSLQKMGPQLKASLPAHVNVDKFVRVTMTAVQNNADLLDADRKTLFMAASRAAQMGLLPDGREGAIVTFSKKCQFMPMVAGIMKLVRNSGEISTWSVQAVYENDDFDFELGDNERIVHKPALTNRGKIRAAYSIVTMKDGEKSREVMGIDEIEIIRKRSRSGNSGPWMSDFAEMCKKTVVRRHAKRLPMSTDLDGVIHSDDDLFMPAEAEAQPEPPKQPQDKRRPSRLAKVVDQADDAPAHDDDGVIDMEATTVQQPTQQADNDSPI